MVDVSAGVNHIQAVDANMLWELTLSLGTEKRSLSNTRQPCTSYRIEKLADEGQRAIFEWLNTDWQEEKGALTVRVTVDLPRNSGIASWRIWVDNKSEKWGLYDVDFPKCSGYLRRGEYDIAVPTGNAGRLFKNCAKECRTDIRTAGRCRCSFYAQ